MRSSPVVRTTGLRASSEGEIYTGSAQLIASASPLPSPIITIECTTHRQEQQVSIAITSLSLQSAKKKETDRLTPNQDFGTNMQRHSRFQYSFPSVPRPYSDSKAWEVMPASLQVKPPLQAPVWQLAPLLQGAQAVSRRPSIQRAETPSFEQRQLKAARERRRGKQWQVVQEHDDRAPGKVYASIYVQSGIPIINHKKDVHLSIADFSLKLVLACPQDFFHCTRTR